MTKLRQSSPSPELSAALSAKSRYKHHRKNPREEDYSDASPSQSLYESNEDEEEYERPLNDDDDDDNDDDASHMRSDYEINNAPSHRFSSRSINFDTTAISNSASNSPNNLSPQPGVQFASYVNIAPLPIFRGAPKECSVTHLSRFTKVCRANNVSTIDMMMRIFPVTLEDEAALWYDLNIEPYQASLTWEDIKSSFLNAYHKIEFCDDQLQSELMMINQSEEESVRSYFLRLQWILKQWPDNGLPDGLLKGIFIDGLREEFRDWIIPQKPDSLNEALRLAFGFEQVKIIRPGRKLKVLKCGFCDGMHEESGCEVRERMRELWRKSKGKEEVGVGVEVVSLAKSGSEDQVEKELVRSISFGASSGVAKKSQSQSQSQCQCWKHQCWKKKLERNSSLVTGNSTTAE